MDKRIRVSTGSSWEPVVGYSRAIRIGNREEIAGTTAVDGDMILGGNDAYLQTIHALTIIKESLENVGAKLSDVVRTRMFVTDISR